MDDPIYKDPDLYRAFSHCLLKASFKEYEKKVPGTKIVVKINRGQFITGRKRFFGQLFDCEKDPCEMTCWNWLQTLEKMGYIKIESHSKFSIVTVINWDKYQASKEDDLDADKEDNSADE
jgi:hypothetical protein